MGLGATIGLISVESYPTAVRGMGYGISAGFGKAEAAIGTQFFTPIEEAAGRQAGDVLCCWGRGSGWWDYLLFAA